MPLDFSTLDIQSVDEVQAYVKDLNPMNWWETEFYYRILIGEKIHWLPIEDEAQVFEFLKKLTNVDWDQIERAKKAHQADQPASFTVWKKP